MGTVVLDASVLIAFIEPTDVLHSSAARALRQARDDQHDFSVPASVMAETLVGAARRGKRDLVEEKRQAIEDVFGPTRPVDDAVAVEATILRAAERSLRLPDALVIATGIVDDAVSVLTADRRLAKVDHRVKVLN